MHIFAVIHRKGQYFAQLYTPNITAHLHKSDHKTAHQLNRRIHCRHPENIMLFTRAAVHSTLLKHLKRLKIKIKI